MPFKRLLKCTHNLHFNMKNYTTMKNDLIVVLAVLGLTACKESKIFTYGLPLSVNVCSPCPHNRKKHGFCGLYSKK